jgi:hypothetical protein
MIAPVLHKRCVSIAALLALPVMAFAQAAPRHPVVCAEGVHIYQNRTDLKAPYDTLDLPPAPPVRVTSPQEAEAAERALRERVGKAGGNAVLVMVEPVDMPDGTKRLRRTVVPLFIPAEADRAAAACRKP